MIQTAPDRRTPTVTVLEGPLVQQYVWNPGAKSPRMAPREATAELVHEEEPDDQELLGYESKIGGYPCWIQADETPGEGWRLLLQLYEPDGTTMNFGTGILYAFLSPHGLSGKIITQC